MNIKERRLLADDEKRPLPEPVVDGGVEYLIKGGGHYTHHGFLTKDVRWDEPVWSCTGGTMTMPQSAAKWAIPRDTVDALVREHYEVPE